MFLISVGTVINPIVLFNAGTLGIAAIFTLACIGGKLIAAALTRPLFSYTWDEVGVLFSLSVSQAAATLAATFIGLEIGLLDSSAVNAVMLVIIVSLLVSSICARRYGERLPQPTADTRRLGRSVLVQVDEPSDIAQMVDIAGRLVRADAGVLRPVVVACDGQTPPNADAVSIASQALVRRGIDAEVEIRYDSSTRVGLLHGVASHNSSLVMVPAATESWLPTLLGASQHALVAECPVPVALVRGGNASVRRAVFMLSSAQSKRPRSATRIASDLVVRLQKGGLDALVVADGAVEEELGENLAGVETVEGFGPDWIESYALESDLIVVPGGQNGALATARVTRQAARAGLTIVVVADARSVSALDVASQGLGLVPGRAGIVDGV
jgi:hypothetical protein